MANVNDTAEIRRYRTRTTRRQQETSVGKGIISERGATADVRFEDGDRTITVKITEKQVKGITEFATQAHALDSVIRNALQQAYVAAQKDRSEDANVAYNYALGMSQARAHMLAPKRAYGARTAYDEAVEECAQVYAEIGKRAEQEKAMARRIRASLSKG